MHTIKHPTPNTQHPTPNTQHPTLITIQLLRAVAAICVVYGHSTSYVFPEISFGGFGVDIFFIISGFVIAVVVSKSTDNFLLKRFARIIPLYWLVTFLTILLCLLFPKWFNNTSVSLSGIIKSLFFIPYKVGTSGPIVLSGWTLNCEILFYLIIGICIYVIKNKKYLTLFCIATLTVFIVLLNIINSENYIFQFYRDRALLPEFIYGIILYHFFDYFNKQIQIKKSIMLFLIFLILGISALLFLILSSIYKMNISDNRNIQIGIPSLILIISMLVFEKSINPKNSLIKFGLKLGDASYVIYLFHPFFIYFLQRLIYPRIFGNNGGIIIKLLQIIFGLLITIAGSMLLYDYIDNPIQKKLRYILKFYHKQRHCT
jgi:peptidoglycan/LPS O-acetylase OafA/YrhL